MTVDERAPEQDAAPASPSPRWRPDRRVLRYVLTVYLAVRAGLTLLGLLAVALLPPNAVANVPGWPAPALTPGWHNAVTAWERWDALWFLRIASQGYRSTDSSAAFFPLYPTLVHWVGVALGSHWLLAAYLVSNLALIGALYALYVLTAQERGDATARLTVVLLCVFPTGFYLFAPYSESLFLLLTVGALLAARRGHWVVAALCGIGAAATRSIGLVIALPLAVEAVQQSRGRDLLRLLPGRLLAAAAPPLGLVGYLLWWHQQVGDALRPFHSQGGFGRSRSWPWQTVYDGLHVAVQFIGVYAGGYHTSDAVVVLVAFAAAVWVTVRTRPLYGAYTLASLVFPLLLPFGGRPFMSMPRFVLVVFPLLWALAAFAQRFRAEAAVVAASAAGLGVFGLLFVNWYFIF